MPEFKRQPLLPSEVEEQLKKDILKWWRAGYLAKDIAHILDFGVKGKPYEKLKIYHVYFYRWKFANDKKDPDPRFRRRRRPAFGKGTSRESRYKQKPKALGVMQPEVFIETLNRKVPKFPFPSTINQQKKRTYIILHFWSPLRKSEIFERIIDDFEITKDKLIIHLLRKKKGHKPDDDDEPISIPLSFPLMDEVVEWLQGEEWKVEIPDPNDPDETILNNRPWKITKDTALNWVKNAFEGFYCHYFRFNWISDATDDPETSIRELEAKTRLTLPALLKYIITDEKAEETIDRRKLERLKAKGLTT